MEITVVKCLQKSGLVSDLELIHHKLDAGQTAEEQASALISVKNEARCPKGKADSIDRLLTFAGSLEPLLLPHSFAKSAREYPDLVCNKLARYYPEAALREANGHPAEKILRRHPFGYRTEAGGSGNNGDFANITLLVKNHLSDEYELVRLFVDKKAPAESILQYLHDLTDGRFQPVAAFPGSAQLFMPGNDLGQEKSQQPRRNSLDPLTSVLATLLDEALVRQGFLAKDDAAPPVRGLDWLANLLKSRVMVALESDLPFAEQTIGQAIKDKVSLPLAIMQTTAPPETMLLFTPPPRPSVVVLPMIAYSQLVDPEKAAHELTIGEHSALIGCTSLKMLPEPIRRIVETTITLPKIDRKVFSKIFVALFGGPPPIDNADESEGWLSYVQPWDLARVAKGESDPLRASILLRHRIEDRLARVTPSHGPSLSDLHGMGEARLRAEMLITDIQAAVAGRIPWDQVDRGMLLAGPPGCGKTALARAIAKDCGVRFVECSAARWQMAGHLGEHLAAMARDFAEARRFAPSILFIDEFDSIGNREQFSGSNAAYHVQVVNAVLAELQGFSERGKVVIIAATNLVENVDPALRRAGRLDRVIKVSLPTIDALEMIFAYYLQKHGVEQAEDTDIALRPIAEAAFGRTGADVSLAVRGALRRARRAGRQICQDDLLAELYERPLDHDLERPLQGEGIRRVALHETGHALTRLDVGGALRQIGYVSIVPRGDGSLGFVALKPDADLTTLCRADYLAHLQVILGGRAAEEIFYGEDGIGGGSGGGDSSDLAKATNLALDMVCRLGLGNRSQLLWRNEPSEEDYKEAEELISEAYSKAKELLKRDRLALERIAKVLIERQEISGEDFVRLVSDTLETTKCRI